MKSQRELQTLGEAVLTLRNLQRYCLPYSTGTRPADASIVEAIDVVLKDMNAKASESTPSPGA